MGKPRVVRPKSKPKQEAKQPVTADDHLDAGTEEEDSGDRWISSGDVPKGVRFYQRAFQLYAKVLELSDASTDKQIVQDARYNMARIQFVVYTKVVYPKLLRKIESQLQQPDPGLVETSIETIGKTHEQAIQLAGGENQCQIDLLYNYAQVLTQAGEELDSAQFYSQASNVYDTVLTRQQQQPEATNSELLETLIAHLQCQTALIKEFDNDRCEKSREINNQISSFVKLNDEEINLELKYEAAIAVAQNSTDLSVWEDAALPQTASRYMAQADAFIDSKTWAGLSSAAKALQQGLQCGDLTTVEQAKLWIAKGDVDWLRSRLEDCEAAKNNCQTLRKNARVFYTNAGNVMQRVILAASSELPRLKREADLKRDVLGEEIDPTQLTDPDDLDILAQILD